MELEGGWHFPVHPGNTVASRAVLCTAHMCTLSFYLAPNRQMTLWLKESPLKVLPVYLSVDMLGFERHTWWNLQVLVE